MNDVIRICAALILTFVLTLAGCKQSEPHDLAGYATRAHSGGDIAFEITPGGMIEGRFVVDLRANTHRGDLADLDLANIVTLTASGKDHRPVQADRLRGHHASGRIAFQLEAPPQRFDIVVRGAREMPELRFQWP